MASSAPGIPNHHQQQQGVGVGTFDMNKLFKPSSATATSPSIPSPIISLSTPPPITTTTTNNINSNLTTSPSFPLQLQLQLPSTPPSSSSYILTPSSSYPPPTGPYHPLHHHHLHPHYLPYPPPLQQQQQPNMQQQHRPPQQPISYPPPPPLPQSNPSNDLLMAFFGNPQQDHSSATATSSDFLMPISSPIPSAPPLNLPSPTQQQQHQSPTPTPPPMRMLSSKLPRGRHLIGNHVSYDVDARLPGEAQPQLEVTPITRYNSDPGLFLGRQIAVNRKYICYGLKLGAIRILNINTALRSLLRGHSQRVSDMAFFAEDVNLLASGSIDGWVFIWKITEGPDEEDKAQIAGKIVLSMQITGEWESVNPRVCWHPHKQEILMVAIGNCILKIDTTKAGKGKGYSAEEPLKCSIDKLIDGVQLVGKHDGEITELSMCQWMTSRLASASMDGTVRIWEDRKAVPVAVLRPYDGLPVNSVTFLTNPDNPEHIVLITGGPLNRDLKMWTTASEQGWLLEAESWQCTQTLELKSSAEPRVEDAFFNQAVALPHAGLFLLANAKKNAIYAVHVDYGPNPVATHMDYIAEFTVTIPILSLTGTSESTPDGDHLVQIYCVQTAAIQQYALYSSQCHPPPLENMDLEKTDPNAARVFDNNISDASTTFETSHGSKSSEMPAGNTISSTHILPSSPEILPISSRPETLASSEVTTLTEITYSGVEAKSCALSSHTNSENIHAASPPLPLSPRLSQKSSGFRSPNSFEPCPPLTDHSGDQSFNIMDIVKETLSDVPSSGDNLRTGDKIVAKNDISMVPNPPVVFKHPTHLVTPSEILSKAASSPENPQISQGMNVGEVRIPDVVVNNDVESIEVEVKVVGEAGSVQNNEFGYLREPRTTVAEKNERSFYSQASGLSIQMARDFGMESYNVEETQLAKDVSVTEKPIRPLTACEEDDQDVAKDMPTKVVESEAPTTVPQSPAPASKAKRQKAKISQASGPSSTSPSPFNSTDSSTEPGCSAGVTSTDAALHQLLAMQDMLEQLMSVQKEMQKQFNGMVSVPVTKEGKRLEASLGRSMEKIAKANSDALWARFQEENTKHEKLERDRTQQMTNLITNCINKDLPALLEKTLKKEIAAVGPAVARAVTPTMEKIISSTITESFQKGVGDKAVNQLEKSVSSKLEATVARQIQAQFQTSGKQALQDALRSSLEASIIPAFELSCKAMFEQIDGTFQNGLVKHTTAAQQQFESTHSPLAIALRDVINSASSVTRTLSGELAEGQRKLLAIAAAGAIPKVGNPLVGQLNNGPLAGLHEMAEAPSDPTKELSRLVAEHKYEEAFTGALHRSDVAIVSWLCSQVDLSRILAMVPLPLSQGVLLALLQQLACDINKETPKKVAWMTDVAVVINPADPMITMHVRPIFEQVYQILGHYRNLPTTSPMEVSSIRLLMHVINSVLMSCK
ncbi:WD40 domain-containing protein [Cephalotus follicularis]|uniref:WD40 domain-containing protein n=1 Tax=Cephalotus follicularis TaxID=3775 RepID=A0A1Q3BRG7_CEPFO|nr:WD40 domain-containing protein [Cephalotus follicularis]